MATKQDENKPKKSSSRQSKPIEPCELDVLKLTPTQKQILAHKRIHTFSELIHTYPLRYTHILPM